MSPTRRARATEPRRAGRIRRWDLEADVVVVGLGCAGACAAIEAREAGADVLVLERASGGGGTSALSGGLIYMGGGTPVQKASGFEDTPDRMFEFLVASSGPGADREKIRVFCDGSVAHYHWLVAHGVPFKESFYPEPGLESATDDCLVYSGGEETHPFREQVPPAPRAHKPRAEWTAGGFLMQRLLAAVERARPRVETDVRAETLVVDAGGRVRGVVACREGRELRACARRGVVLTTGGFQMNDAMLAEHCPLLARLDDRLSAGHDDGSGILMGIGAGGAAIHMDAAECAGVFTIPHRLARGILVNASGQRFMNEDTYYGRIAQESLFHQGGEMYLVVDDDIYETNLRGQEVSWVGETIEELEREMGLPEGSLQATVGLYNRHAEAGRDPVLHKARAFVKPLTSAPFGAFDYRVGSAHYTGMTLGGLKTRPTGEVLTPEGVVVPGLYAAGRTTSGISAGGYSTGISLGDGTFFGRLAGRSAARKRQA